MAESPFSHIIGHEAACHALSRMLQSGRLAHAFLFVGPEGVGRRTLAHALVRAFIGGEPEMHPDVSIIARLTDEKTGKTKSAITVEQVREFTERFSMSAIAGGRKAVIMEEADRMNAAAANSLLKTLEEPRGDALMILCADTIESVPATIASRCQFIRLHPVARKRIEEALVGRGLSAKDAASIAAMSGGRPGVALRIVGDSGYRAELETAGTVLQTLIDDGIPGRLRTAAQLLPKDEGNKTAVLETLFVAWEGLLRDRMLAAIMGGGDARCLADSLRILRDSYEALRRNANPQIALERVLLTL